MKRAQNSLSRSCIDIPSGDESEEEAAKISRPERPREKASGTFPNRAIFDKNFPRS